jgi:Protein of unknown function (DUF2934)
MTPLQSRQTTINHSPTANQQASGAIETPRAQAIEVRAYELWLERGSPHGSPEEDWYRAEQEFFTTAESQPRSYRSSIAES